MIARFVGEYRWLSNFHPCKVTLDGHVYRSVEAAYQAGKTVLDVERNYIRGLETPGQAKRAGRRITLRDDWDTVKVSIMDGLLRQKFAQPEFYALLIETGDREIIEGNTWHDGFWGSCSCPKCETGLNVLGRLIMQIRSDLQNERPKESEDGS